MVNKGIPTIQKGLTPRRKILFDLLGEREMRLVVPGVHDGELRRPGSVARRYARLNPTLKEEKAADPYLEFKPAFSSTEHVQLEVFKRWMSPEKAKKRGVRIFERAVVDVLHKKKPTGEKKEVVLADSPAKFCSFFSNTSKMACGSWSIPAGGVSMGGTCPSANTTSEVETYDLASFKNAVRTIPKLAEKLTRESGTFPRKLPMADSPPLVTLGLERNICQKCYAAKGNFGNSNTQLWQMARFAWAFDAVERGTFVEEMTAALRAFLSHVKARASKKQDPRFFRIHDSGDFFSPEYMLGWARVAANLPEVRFWAPTRVWMLWPDAVAEAVAIAPNLTLRPSALQFDDPAPIVDGIPVAGSTAHVASKADALEPARLGLAQWDCPAYALAGKACAGAMDSKKIKTAAQRKYIEEARGNFRQLFGASAPADCRVCWVKPEITVSYHAH